jgi:hypothetical protein
LREDDPAAERAQGARGNGEVQRTEVQGKRYHLDKRLGVLEGLMQGGWSFQMEAEEGAAMQHKPASPAPSHGTGQVTGASSPRSTCSPHVPSAVTHLTAALLIDLRVCVCVQASLITAMDSHVTLKMPNKDDGTVQRGFVQFPIFAALWSEQEFAYKNAESGKEEKKPMDFVLIAGGGGNTKTC